MRSDPAGQEGGGKYKTELFLNQLWQSANFLAKAGFLFLLTPLMLSKWGPEGYGLFALASSLLVSMALLDGGVRSLTRLRLAEALKEGKEDEFRRIYSEGLFTFSSLVAVACLAVVALAWTGLLGQWLNLPEGGAGVLVLTVFLTGILMISLLGLEPLAARENLSLLKAANTWGALVAIPLVAGAVWMGASVAIVVAMYSLCLIVPNIIVAARSGILQLAPWKLFSAMGVGVIFSTLKSGVWFYLTTVALVVKTHALTFLVSAIAGPAEAGMFYVLLRLTEIIGTVGATASETSLASLAAARDAPARASSFRQSWLYVAVFCFHGAIALTFLGDGMIHLWLSGAELLPRGAGFAMAVFGLSGAFSRVIVNAAMGLNIVRPAALANLAEAATDIALALVGYHMAGLAGLFLGGSAGLVFLLFPALSVARLCGRSFFSLYVFPLKILAAGLAFCGVLQAFAGVSPSPLIWVGALGISGGVALWQLKRIHSEAPQTAPV